MLATLTFSPALLASKNQDRDDCSTEHATRSISAFPDEILVHILSFLKPREILDCSTANHQFLGLTNEQFQAYIDKVYPQYKAQATDPDEDSNEVKSPKHLAFLLEQFSKPIGDYGVLSSLHTKEKLLSLINAAFSAPKASLLKGILFKMVGQRESALDHFLIADKAGYPLAKTIINQAIHRSAVGQAQCLKQERFADLEARAAKGNTEAQNWLTGPFIMVS